MTLFQPDDVISFYGDDQAVADGVLVDLPAIGCTVSFRGRLVNRMSCALYADLKPFAEAQAAVHEDSTAKSLASIIRTKLLYARDTAAPGEQRDYLFALPSGSGDVWLIANELGGWTIMWPSDY